MLTTQRPRLTSRTQALFAQWSTRSQIWNTGVQWLIASVVGVGLGGSVLISSLVPLEWAVLFIMALIFPFVMMIAGNIQKLLLGIIIIEIPIQLDTYLNYQEQAASLGAVGGLNVSVTTFCLVILYALWLAELLVKTTTLPRSLLRLSLPLVTYLAFDALSIIVARDVELAVFEITLLLQAFLLYVYIVGRTQTKQDVLFIVTMIFVALSLESMLMIGARAIGQSIEIANVRISITAGDLMRVEGTLGSPNSAGAYLSIALASTFGILFIRTERWRKFLAIVAFCLGSTALLLTFSRGGWLSFAIALVILGLTAWWRGWLSPLVIAGVAFIVVLLALFYGDAITTRLLADDKGAAYARIPLMRIAFRMISDHPILGVGANNTALVLPQYLTPEFSRTWIYVFHNKYLLVWAETGIGALAAFIWFLLATIRRGQQAWKVADQQLSPIALGFTAAIIGQMAHMAVDIFNSRPQVQMLWLVAGLMTAIGNIATRTAQGVEHSYASTAALELNRK